MVFLAIYGQDANIEIRGNVFDVNSKAPLINATIKIKGQNLGAITNERGQFFMISNKLPVILVISYVGFESQEYAVEFEPLQPLTIKMIPKTERLKGVVITTQKIDTIYKDSYYSVLDYELLSDGIVLLIYKYTLNKAVLVYKDYEGNKIAEIKTLPGKPRRLYKDCLDELHLFTRNKSYQIFFEKERIQLYPAVDLNEFFQFMQYCELFIQGKLYYHEKGYLDLVNIYYAMDTASHQKVNFYTVLDQDKIDFLMYNPENQRILNTDFTPSLSDLKGLAEDGVLLNQIRNMEVELRFNQMAYFPSIYAPIFQLDNAVVIFNHPNSTIDFFNEEDSLTASIPINYQLTTNKDFQDVISSITRNEKWQEEVFIDEINHTAYTSFLNLNGTKTIKEIDLQSGVLIRSIKIPFPYVEKIKFRNGFMYYIYKGWDESQKKKLFRQKLN